MIKLPTGFHFPFHVRREAVTLTLLTGLAIVLFVGVTALSQLYHAQQGALADRWASRGTAELKSGKFKSAAADFHSALRYSSDDYDLELGLAESLLGLKRTNEAATYLNTLWEQQPENGMVNRQLARIAAGKGDTGQALRYYHNAIYGIWAADADHERRNTRWELIKYLLKIKARTLAQSELISLAADFGEDPSQQIELGNYFLEVQDPAHALAAFRLRLSSNAHNPEALAGAGVAAFELADYRSATNYLEKAIAENREDRESASRLDLAQKVLHMDPYHHQGSDAQRNKVVIDDFKAAGDRLAACPSVSSIPDPGSKAQTLFQSWSQLKPRITPEGLRRGPDTANRAMDVVFEIEHQAAGSCGNGTATDQALLLISKLHEGS